MTPTYRGSLLDQYRACPFAAASTILQGALDANPSVDGFRDWRAVEEHLAAYTCAEGVEYIMVNCGMTALPVNNRVTQIGIQAHEFAHMYGAHLIREKKRSDWTRAAELAEEKAYIGEHFVPKLNKMLVAWAQEWEHVPVEETDGDVDLSNGSWESGWQVKVPGADAIYEMHPDYCRLSADRKTIEIHDLKSGLRTYTYDAQRPDIQLARYALAFKWMLPSIKRANLRLVFINPDHPRADEPLQWEVDFDARPLEATLITSTITAIKLTTEFRPKPGCWLCPYCEWVTHCPKELSVQMQLLQEATDGAMAWAAHEASRGLSSSLAAERSALRTLVKKLVEREGPIALGKDEDGDDIEYAIWWEPDVDIPSMPAFVAEAWQKNRMDLMSYLKVDNAKALAEACQMEDPFADAPEGGTTQIESIKVKLAVRMGVRKVADREGLQPGEVHRRISELARSKSVARRIVPTAEMTDHQIEALEGDEDLGAL